MFLKKITIHGFKSFADRATITLPKSHITGIVGPNGSGKSNVIDAVRWVMGEQNTKVLRGEKATDIIFSGSVSRKAIGMAEVTLVFDNSDSSEFCPIELRHEAEISLTRRIYADGEREFEINRKPCRLKDIVNFFSSASLGGRGYSMIQQGQVDQILQAKPEQLRELIEETAGTLVFKKHRQESLQKLDDTKVNLARVDDIEGELRGQLDSLEEQVKAAKTYQALSLALMDCELALFHFRYKEAQTRCDGFKERIEQATAEESKSLAELSSLDANLTKLKNDLDLADPEIRDLLEDVSSLREKIASSESSLAAAQQLIDGGDEQCEKNRLDLGNEEKNLTLLSDQYKEAKKVLEQTFKESEAIENWLDDFEFQLDQVDEELAAVRVDLETCKNRRVDAEKKIDSQKIRKETVKRSLDKATKEKADLQKRLVLLEDDNSKKQILLEGSQVQLNTCQRTIDQEVTQKHLLEVEVDAKERELKEREIARQAIQEEFISKKSLLHSLENFTPEQGDFNALVTELRAAAAENGPKIVPLTDVISFAEGALDNLPAKVQIAFERWSGRLLVESPEHLGSLLDFILAQKTNSLAATLLYKEMAVSAPLIDGAEPLAPFFVPQDHIPGLGQLLSRLYYVEQVTDLPALLEAIPDGVTLFTGDGHILTRSQDMHVGGKKTKGILSRRAESTTLKREIASLEKKLAGAQLEMAQLQDGKDKIRIELKRIDQSITFNNKKLLEATANFQSLKHELQSIRNISQDIARQTEELERGFVQLDAEYQELANSDSEFKTLLENARSKITELSSREKILADTSNEMKRQKEQKRIDLASLTSRSQTLHKGFIQMEAQMEIVAAKHKKSTEELAKLKEKIREAKNNHASLQDRLKAFYTEKEASEKRLVAKRDENKTLVDQVRFVENQIRAVQDAGKKWKDTLGETELELERSRIVLNSSLEQAKERYQIDLQRFEAKELGIHPNDMGKKIKEIKAQIDGLGLVNMRAVEEYNKLEERANFINEQKNEILSSIDVLQIAINEIEENSKIKFFATFDLLNEEFGKLFPILFPSGEAKIQLVNPEQPLESGVEILVRLPGKAPQNMRLFSGGEKALTAIALIFALLKSKPTPFCFLDEVDAPLDEANISRYSELLENLSKRFQFIVITHRRQTMETLDTLYGVTMQEPGISKVVSVDMKTALPTHLQKFMNKPTAAAAAAYE